MSSYMWQTGPGEFRIQTDEVNVVRKLSRRRKPKLVAYGINKYVRIFELSGIRPDNARRTLGHLLGQEIKMNVLTGEYEPQMHSHMNLDH